MMMPKKSENKLERYSVAAICKKIEKHTIRFDHPSQRCSDQWNTKMKSNMISDILQGNPIPSIILAEQIINGVSIVWNIDGKQRCTNVYSYVHDGFKISGQVRRSKIYYQANVTDEKGKIVLDGHGVPVVEVKEFDITNKKFSQLPEELRDKILEYCFDAVLYLDCSSEDIVYHIARYNDGKPMNKVQKGVVNLGEEYAGEVKKLSDHSFFTDCADFGKNGKTSGNIDRCICETVMASNHLDSWAGNNLEYMCNYLKANADLTEFEDVENTLDRLEDIVDGDSEVLFTNKESFIWMTVFHKFKSLNIDDDRFGDFIRAFVTQHMNEIKIEECSYKELEGNKSTKDKSLVTKKINHIVTLMNRYLDVVENSAA
jgi:hypothetical protein